MSEINVKDVVSNIRDGEVEYHFIWRNGDRIRTATGICLNIEDVDNIDLSACKKALQCRIKGE